SPLQPILNNIKDRFCQRKRELMTSPSAHIVWGRTTASCKLGVMVFEIETKPGGFLPADEQGLAADPETEVSLPIEARDVVVDAGAAAAGDAACDVQS
ncbi:MAG: hypothetical protein ACKPKO_46395, partial [Candidatus Fonsibacter sp.]